jgi:hypothetical protein
MGAPIPASRADRRIRPSPEPPDLRQSRQLAIMRDQDLFPGSNRPASNPASAHTPPMIHSAKRIHTADDLWTYGLEIREWRKELQTTLQFTYSSLPLCFGLCLRKGWLIESDLAGLGDERIKQILSISTIKHK